MSWCEGKSGGEYACGNPAAFAVWYDGDKDSAKGACGKHLAQVTRQMLADATQVTGQYVKVTRVR